MKALKNASVWVGGVKVAECQTINCEIEPSHPVEDKTEQNNISVLFENGKFISVKTHGSLDPVDEVRVYIDTQSGLATLDETAGPMIGTTRLFLLSLPL